MSVAGSWSPKSAFWFSIVAVGEPDQRTRCGRSRKAHPGGAFKLAFHWVLVGHGRTEFTLEREIEQRRWAALLRRGVGRRFADSGQSRGRLGPSSTTVSTTGSPSEGSTRMVTRSTGHGSRDRQETGGPASGREAR